MKSGTRIKARQRKWVLHDYSRLALEADFLPPEAFQGRDYILLEVGNDIVSLGDILRGRKLHRTGWPARLTVGAPLPH